MIEGLGRDVTKGSVGTIKNVTKSLGGLLGKVNSVSVSMGSIGRQSS
jgi:hypothetical protein